MSSAVMEPQTDRFLSTSPSAFCIPMSVISYLRVFGKAALASLPVSTVAREPSVSYQQVASLNQAPTAAHLCLLN